jgi:hypothetical protein
MTRSTVVYRGVPLWLFVLVVFALIRRNRALRSRPGNVAVRLRSAPGTSWSRGNGVWVRDVFAVRKGLGDRSESFLRVTAVTTRAPEDEEAKALRRLEDPVIATVQLADGDTIEIAAPRKQQALLLGPFAAEGPVPTEMPSVDQFEIQNADQTVAVAS